MYSKKRLYKNKKNKTKSKKKNIRRKTYKNRKSGKKGGVRPGSPTSVVEMYPGEKMGDDGRYYQKVNLSEFNEDDQNNKIYYSIVDESTVRHPRTNQFVTLPILLKLGRVTFVDFRDPETALLEFTDDHGFVRSRDYYIGQPNTINLYTVLDIDPDEYEDPENSEYFRQRQISRGGARPTNAPSNQYMLTNEQKDFFINYGLSRDQIVRLERTLNSRFNVYSTRYRFDRAVQEVANHILENGTENFNNVLTRYVSTYAPLRGER
jgi:hypothetical protein